MAMKLHQLESLIALVDAGSMRGAACSLGLTQPTLSARIAELEQEVGAALVIRTVTGTRLTPAGDALLGHARLICGQILRAEEAVGRVVGGGGMTLSIGASPLAAAELVGPVASDFWSRFPDVQLRIVEGMFPRLAVAMREGLLDLMLVPAPSAGRDFKTFQVQELVAYPMCVVARREHPLAKVTRLQDIVQARWIVGSALGNRRSTVEELFAEHGLPKPNIAAHADTLVQMQSLLAFSDLLGLLPLQLAAGQTLVKLSIEASFRPARLCLVTRSSPPLSATAQAFAELVRARASAAVRALATSRMLEAGACQ